MATAMGSSAVNRISRFVIGHITLPLLETQRHTRNAANQTLLPSLIDHICQKEKPYALTQSLPNESLFTQGRLCTDVSLTFVGVKITHKMTNTEHLYVTVQQQYNRKRGGDDVTATGSQAVKVLHVHVCLFLIFLY